ncbi:hypothetical protein LJR219_002817 [Phenylobacterium sp. LjRoot219]|uniref:alginate O-acetyltransferase AlgX-related protein n=1 Tax=Phenylobacterium sp. LjRoot219 TaxID=3342283 RepID=UPI003ED0334A
MRPLPKRHWRRLTATCLAVLAAGLLLPAALDPPDLQENREPRAAPATPRSPAELRAWPKAMDAYVTDSFPARTHLIAALNFLRYRLGVSGAEQVIVGRDGWLFYDNGRHFDVARNNPAFTDDQARDWLAGLAGRTEWLKARGVHHLLLIGPDKEMIVPQYGPDWYRGPDPNRPAPLLGRLNAVAGVGEIVDPGPVLQQQARWGLNVYNPYETHWTGLGAYQAYVMVMQRLAAAGITDGPRPIAAFREITDDPHKPRNLSQMLGVASFVDADYQQLRDPQTASNTVWLTEKQNWTAPQVIETGHAGKPVLLMLRDSFSLALLPFLEGHFSRIVLYHHQDGFWRPELVERFKPDVVIFEVIESGLQYVMNGSPPASEAAQAQIARALAAPHRVVPQAASVAAPSRRIEGDGADNKLHGGRKSDAIHGRAGNDTLDGRAGDDVLHGGRGADRVSGAEGRDWVSGDRDDDTLTGGPGADRFHIAPGFGADVVTDFAAADGDLVELPTGAPYTVRQSGADTVLELAGARLTLRGVRAADLPAGWVVFR